MSTPQGNSGSVPPSFNAAPSSRAIGLVAIAVLVGVLLLVIVDADNVSNKNNSAASQTNTTTTVPTNTENNSTEASTTSTTTPVSGIKKPAEVSVLVLNGSSGAGIASAVSTAVGELGYKMLTPGNDSSAAKGTIVYYKAGFEKDAKQISTNLFAWNLDRYRHISIDKNGTISCKRAYRVGSRQFGCRKCGCCSW